MHTWNLSKVLQYPWRAQFQVELRLLGWVRQTLSDYVLRLLSAGLITVQVKTPLPGLVCSAAPLALLSHKHSLAFWREAKLCSQALFLVPSRSTSKTLNQILPLLIIIIGSYGMGKADACVSWTCLVAPGWSNKDMQWYERLCKTCGKLLCDALWGKSAARLCKCQVDENGHLCKVNLKGGPFDVWHTHWLYFNL